MDGVQLTQEYRATKRRHFFTTNCPGHPGTNLIDLEGLKDEPWSHLVILNPAPRDWESRALTKLFGKAYKVVLLRELLRHSIFEMV